MELQKVLQISFSDTAGKLLTEGCSIIYTSNGSDASALARFNGFSKRGALILENIITGKSYNVMPQTIVNCYIVSGDRFEF